MKKHNRSLIVGVVALVLVVLLNILSGGWVSPGRVPDGALLDSAKGTMISKAIKLSGFNQLHVRLWVDQSQSPMMIKEYDSATMWLSGLTHGLLFNDFKVVSTITPDGQQMLIGISQHVDQYLIFKMFTVYSYDYELNMVYQADGTFSSVRVSSDLGSPWLMNGLQLVSLLMQWLLIFEGLSYLLRFLNKPSNTQSKS